MALSAGTRLGPYEILSALGAGGMGEVYKARDTRLNRTIAVKILSADLTSSPDARQRFEQEARTISQLSHPHICALYDVGHQDDTEFLVMELLEGETLAARLAKGPLPLPQLLDYGVDIADALDHAHRHGIVHRDLKPANVMATTSGLKLLDFGLAKAAAPLFPGSMSMDTAATPQQSVQGTIAGTLQYMAPEQLEGRPADARSDIFAFGAVLYEMATGKKAFTAGSPVALASAILHDEPPPLASSDAKLPAALNRVVRICLAKDPEQRWRTAHDIGLQLAGMKEDGAPTVGASTISIAGGRGRWLRWMPWALTAVAACLAAAAWLRPGPVVREASPPASIRFSLPPPPGGAFWENFESLGLALSPDGSQLAFVATDPAGGRRIWLRPMSAPDARPLPGTEGAMSLFWSPDGRSIAFFSGDKLKRLDLRGGAPVSVCAVREGIGFFGTWGADGEILFASIEGDAIFRVSLHEGVPVEILKPARSQGEVRIMWPWFLPDGRRVLYLSRLRDGTGRLMLAEGKQPAREVMPVVSNVQYVDPGYLVFAREGTLVGQRFDTSRGTVVGEPFSIAEPVGYFFPPAKARFTTSRNGAVVFQSHSDEQRLAWFDRAGREVGTVAERGGYSRVRISPDGRKLSFERAHGGGPDLWEADLERGVETRLTSDPGSETAGTWAPDGHTLFFMADRGGPPHLFRRNLTTGAEEEVLPAGTLQEPEDVSPDGRTLVFTQRAPGGNDIWTLPVSGAGKPSLLIQSPFDEQSVRFSPDGRFIAFASNASGRFEVYASPFPATGERVRVSGGGANLPRWSRDGRELFYVSGDGSLVAVPIGTTPTLHIGAPVALFTLKSRPWLSFDVSLDGKRFLAVVPEITANEQPLSVIVNWPAEVGR